MIALSSGESGFYALVKAGSMGGGMAAMIVDLGLRKEVRIWCDATAGKGIASRRGCGKVRHLHTPSLWLQRAVSEGRLSLHKVAGPLNPSDLGTKHVSSEEMWSHLGRMNIYRVEGHSKLALKAEV